MDSIITPNWPVPSNIKAFVSTRIGGVSQQPYDSFNMGGHVGDVMQDVMSNRLLLKTLACYPGDIQWLNQTHSTFVLELPSSEKDRNADACYTNQADTVCAVLTADCLPVLFCDPNTLQVAAAHAGWRGLCDGVLEETLKKFSNPQDVVVWFGPAIGPDAFEVGPEVRSAFMAVDPKAELAFKPSSHDGKWLGDLYSIARQRLSSLGCCNIYGGEFCTFSDVERFYSYRRDGVTGRMASLIWQE
ncbi:peptidoglycan editing factor PgeF [Marinomonas atlantica]|uniref:peptidoglycan editing factor PgeF n=1 Tax=Marinomonas atlantica TaxID=1806668 RepID=UPI0008360154|nr:peptidoglycan editing factor PgeF [Marinomonas atlantica]